jgi:hypothetical protein
MIYTKGAGLMRSSPSLRGPFSVEYSPQREFSVMEIMRSALIGTCLLVLACGSASAQQVTGVPGSPGATTTIDGKQLPPPDPKFGGVIGDELLARSPSKKNDCVSSEPA